MNLNDIVVLKIPKNKKGAFIVDEETKQNYMIYKSSGSNGERYLVLTDMS